MKCSECGYYWKENWDDYPGCHFVGPHQWAPCEQEDDDSCDITTDSELENLWDKLEDVPIDENECLGVDW